MKLSDKISELRKAKGLTQEKLADICNVSRQSVSKWETDIALPEVDKLLVLSNLFRVSVDVLLRDDLTIKGIKESHICGSNAVYKKKESLFEGILIKESLKNESIIDYLTVHKVELWNTGGKPKYWTALYFTASDINFPELVSRALIEDESRGGNWFVDFKAGNTKYIVFHDLVLKYTIGDYHEKQLVCDKCRELGISDEEMHWQE